jgi:hypothetical protein
MIQAIIFFIRRVLFGDSARKKMIVSFGIRNTIKKAKLDGGQASVLRREYVRAIGDYYGWRRAGGM